MRIFFVFAFFTLVIGCTNISPINNRPPNITGILDTELDPILLVYNYYDSVAPQFGWNNPPKDWRNEFIAEMNGVALGRIYSLDTPGVREMYHVIFTEDMIITRVFTENKLMWLNGSEVSEEEKQRIKQRFNDEVLKKMEEYAIQNKLPDSIVYVNRSLEVR